MKYIAVIDADEKPVCCEFIGCNGNVAPYLIGATTNVKALEQGPAISREAVERIIDKWLSHSDYELKDHIYSMTKEIHNLPSVTPPEPRKGHWIRIDKNKLLCSKCGVIHFIAQYPHGKIVWCPNCGATMESEDT